MRRISAGRRLLAALCLLALGGCAARRERAGSEGEYQIYFAAAQSENGAAVASESWTPPAQGGEIQALLDRLLAGPESLSLYSPFPQGLFVRGWRLEDGQLLVDFSEAYGGLSGIELTLSNYCLTLTLCQAPGVETVQVTVEGEASPFVPAAGLRAGDVVLSGAEREPVWVTVELWFGSADGAGLGTEYRQLQITGENTLSSALLSALLAGPEDPNLQGLMPPDTQVAGVLLENGVCNVDLSQSFVDGLPRDEAELERLVASITQTICANLEGAEQVHLWCEGRPIPLPNGLGEPQSPGFWTQP